MQDLAQRRLDADKPRPFKCACEHSKQAHDSGVAFCWLCQCNAFQEVKAHNSNRRNHET